MKTNCQMVRGPAFSLVELLVVIAVIAILLALLMPALNSAKGQARTLLCLSKLKSFGVANASYMGDWSDHVATGSGNNFNSAAAFTGNSWCERVAPYLGDASNKCTVNSNPAHFDCPDRMRVNNGVMPSANNPAWTCASSSLDAAGNPQRITVCAVPSRKAYLIDSVYAFTNIGNMVPYYMAPAGAGGGGYFPRHNNNKMSNALFFDGHAASFGLPPLPIAWLPVCDWFNMAYAGVPDI